ncbi:polyketide cyclase/dehydrase and lipid transporter [Senna tora]|uniref:Polyketide cyclase/dehydrase and lipid transporter n=1 Tax=Senna tora TaxID=362788 RepID=A0A834WD17_9FABA|nr:polyketide cyclase/dehydrase and lipid transporter [Senna tora]
MRVFPVSSQSYSALLFLQSSVSPSSSINLSLLFSEPSKSIAPPSLFISSSNSPSPKFRSFKLSPLVYCTPNSDSPILGDDDDDDDNYDFGVEESESIAEDGVYIEVKKLEKNSRRILSRIPIDAPLATVWNILTDYERLADFIPGLAVNQLLEKGDNYARLFQVGQQDLAFGLKFNAKGIVDCYEKELESLPSGMKRDIEFKMAEGDFQLFEGKWSILQSNDGSCEESEGQETKTTLSYIVDVKPKLWLPVRLIEGRLCSEIKTNLVSIRDEAQKATNRAVHA